MSSWLVPAVIASLSASVVLTLVYWHLATAERSKALALWTWSWFFYSLRFVLTLMMAKHGNEGLLQFLYQADSIISGVLLLWGTYEFIGKPMPVIWFLVAGGTSILVGGFVFSGAPFWLMSAPAFFLLGAADIVNGVAILRHREYAGLEKHVTGWALVLWGVHKLDYPFLRTVQWFAPFGYMIGAILALVVSVGMVLVYMNKHRGALQQSEERYRLLFERMVEGFVLVRAITDKADRVVDFEFVQANDAALRMFGLSGQGTLSKRYSEAVPAGHSLRDFDWVGEVGRVALTGSEARFEVSFSGPAGQKALVCSAFSPRVGYCGFVIEDASERVKVSESRALLQKAVETLPLGLTISDVNGKIIYANQADARMHGRTVGELLKADVRIYAPDYQRIDPYTIHPTPETQRNRESVNIRKDGSTFPVQLQTSIVMRPDGTPIGAATVCEDITERKRVERELRESEGINRTLVEHLPQHVFFKDTESVYKACNESFARSLGITKQDVIGKSDFHLFPPYLAQKYRADDQQIMRSGSARQIEESYVAGGRSYTVQTTKVPVRDSSMRTIGVLGVFHDITERRRLKEDALRNAHLTSLGELAAGVAHEINNPTASIINYAQVVLDTTDEGLVKQRDYLQRIMDEGARIEGIVRSLLRFARKDMGEKRPIDLKAIIDDALALTLTKLHKDGILLDMHLPAPMPVIHANHQQLVQVMLNIISNAHYALSISPNSPKTLRVAVDAPPEADVVAITFEDNGCGIAQDALAKIMEPFFSTKPHGIGTGLGLSISHGIVADHGGQISVQSVKDRYTRITITLPRWKANA